MIQLTSFFNPAFKKKSSSGQVFYTAHGHGGAESQAGFALSTVNEDRTSAVAVCSTRISFGFPALADKQLNVQTDSIKNKQIKTTCFENICLWLSINISRASRVAVISQQKMHVFSI